MAHPNGSSDTLEKHQYEVCNAFARAAVAMRDAAQTAENFSNWFSRVNNLQNIPTPPMLNGLYNFAPIFGGQQQQQPYQSSEVEQTGKKRKTSGDQEGKRKRQVKEKKPKDVNAPKRPPSAYLLFQNDVRKNFKGEHPDMPYSQVLSEISKLWHALTPEEKAPYVQATADSKVLYDKAKADYDAHSPTETSANPPTKAADSTPSVSKSAAKAPPSSDDDDDGNDDDDNSSKSSADSSEEEEEEEEEEVPEPVPEPPRKKSKKEAVKAPTPPPTKVDKPKKKKTEEKKKKKTDKT